MTMTAQLYESRFGWVMSLAPGWSCLESEPDDRHPAPTAVTFVTASDPSVTLRWMYTPRAVSEPISSAFIRGTTIVGPRNPAEAEAILNNIFPLLGKIVKAQVIALADGTRALELEESYFQESTREEKRSYQLVFAINGRPGDPVRFQRLSFYAAEDTYKLWVKEVLATSRTFRYRSPWRA